MKTRINLIVLTLEIAAIALLHAVKLSYSEKDNKSTQYPVSSNHSSFPIKPFYTLTGIKKGI